MSERRLLWAVGLSRRQNVYAADVALIFSVAKQRHRVVNSAAYDEALPRRGSRTVWFTDAASRGIRPLPSRRLEP
ncbi:MAG: hypothetical protein ACRYGG_06680 [Janthinobacterium lividum]